MRLTSFRSALSLGALCTLFVSAAPAARAARPSRPAARVQPAGDTLRGLVRDSAGHPIDGAVVTVVELGRTALTGSDGAFRFAGVPASRYTLTVQRPGYAPALKRIEVAAGVEPVTFTLAASTFRVSPVTITATRDAIDPLASPLSTGALFGERLRREHEVSLAHALDGLPGIRTLSTGQQVGKPMIRGLTGPRVLVLDNGMRLEDYSWSDEDGPSIDSRLAERVEVIRGPASVLYGSDAIGGVINVVPDALPDARGQAPFVRQAGEMYGATNNSEVGGLLRVEGAGGAIGWRATAIGRRADNFHTPTGNPDTPTGNIYDTGFHAINGEAAVGVHGERSGATLRYERYGGDFGLLDGPPVPEDDKEGPLRRVSDDRVQGTTSWLPQAGGGRFRLETRSEWQHHTLQELVGGSRVAGDTPSFDLRLNTISTDVLLHHMHDERFSGTIGVSGLHQDNTSSGVFPLVPGARTNHAAAFVFEQMTSGRWTAQAGARADAHHVTADSNGTLQLGAQTRNVSAFSGDLGAVFRPVAGMAISGNVGRAFRAPTLFELFTNGPHLGEDRYEIGLPGANPEVSLNVDASVRWERGRYRGEVAGYRNRIDDFIFIQPTGTTQAVPNDEGGVDTLDVYQYTQTSRAVLQGVDLSAEVLALPTLTLRGRADVLRGTNSATGSPLPLMPPVRGDLEVELHSAEAGGWHHAYASLGTQLVARQKRLGPFDTSTGGYALLQLAGGLAREMASRRFYLDVRVRNATDRKYHDFLSRYKGFAYEEGRNITLRVSTGL